MNYGGLFDGDNLKKQIAQYEKEMAAVDFWDNVEAAEKTIAQKNKVEKKIKSLSMLKEKTQELLEMANLLKEQEDSEMQNVLINEMTEIQNQLEELEIYLLLNSPYDDYNAILEIHTGAGGTEANDWVAMLYRMYLRFLEKENYQYEILSEIKGEEVGFKNIAVLIKGDYVYGYLKHEHGVHRLVRISPFDSNARRHTSFAFVDVVPYFDKDVKINIDEKDLKIDVFRSSGAGGQSVNTTDSAVRITHLPTKIVVTCQNQRSQIQNKEQAMTVLKNKLWTLELTKQEESLRKIRGDAIDINFGSQIRSYVMHPYSLVKDHRTNTEISAVEKVLDGDLHKLINDNLKRKD